MSQHSIAKVAGAAQPGPHVCRRCRAALSRVHRGRQCAMLLQCLHKRNECIQHRPVAWLSAAQFADGLATLLKCICPTRLVTGKGVATTKEQHSVERTRGSTQLAPQGVTKR